MTIFHESPPRRFNEPDYDQFIAGEPGQSNWPFPAGLPDRPEKLIYLVDVEGITRLSTEDKTTALAFYKAQQSLLRKPKLRKFLLTEEVRQEEDERRRERLWLEMIYKPTPARHIHHRR